MGNAGSDDGDGTRWVPMVRWNKFWHALSLASEPQQKTKQSVTDNPALIRSSG